VPVGGSERLAVEVRDEFNAPKSGVNVTFEVVNGAGGFPEDESPGDNTYTVTSDANGKASATFLPTAEGDILVEATADLNDQPGTQETERVGFSIVIPQDDDDDGDDGGMEINPRDSIALQNVDKKGEVITLTFENLASSSAQWNKTRIPFFVSQSGQPRAETADIRIEERAEIHDHIIGHEFEDIEPSPLTFDPQGGSNSTRTVDVIFENTTQNNWQTQRGDFFVLIMLNEENARITYFVNVPKQGGGQGTGSTP
jgi:hypothetical protein